MKELAVGITYLDGMGGYFKEDRHVILCAVRAKLYPKLADIVSDTDPCAFTIVTTAKEIYGEGFLHYPEKIRQKNKLNSQKCPKKGQK